MNGTERNHPLVERLAVRRRTTPGVLEHGRLYRWYARFQRRSIKSGLLERLLQRLSLSADAASGTLVWRNARQADDAAAESMPHARGAVVARAGMLAGSVVSGSFSRLASEALNRRAAKSGYQSAAQSTAQSGSQSAAQGVTQSTAQGVTQSAAQGVTQSAAQGVTQSTAQGASPARLARPIGVAGAAEFGSRRAQSRTGRADVAGFSLRMQARHGGTAALTEAVGGPADAPVARSATQASTRATTRASTQTGSIPALSSTMLSRADEPMTGEPGSLELLSRHHISHESVDQSVVHGVVHEVGHETVREVTHEYLLRESGSRESVSSLERMPPSVSHSVESRALTPASASTPFVQRVSQRAAAAQSATEALREVSFSERAPAPEPRNLAAPVVRNAMPATFERAVNSAAQPTLLLRKAASAAAKTPGVSVSSGDRVAHPPAESSPSHTSRAAEIHHQAARLRSEPVMETRQFDKLMEKLVARFEIEARRRGLYRWR